jgi:hypothetical protein
MAPPQPITIIEALPWPRSTATRLSLSELVTAGQLAANEDARPAVWIVPHPNEREPNPPFGYVVSFIRFHERGFAAPASRFMRVLCNHYGVELQNFTPNVISQAATFVGVCEGFLGIPVNWDLWVHLFRAELHTLTTPEPKTRRVVRAGGLTIGLRNTRKELYIPCTMTSNNSEWEWGWFYLRNDGAGLPAYSGKVLKDKADSWHHGVSPPSHQTRLDSLLNALKELADGGLTAGCILANLHHRRNVPLMERPLRIFKMHEDADPVALAESQLVSGLFPWEYAATRARRAIDHRTGRNDDATLWAFTMLPVGLLVSRFPLLLVLLARGASVCLESLPVSLQIRVVNTTRSDPPTPRSRAHARAVQRREQERAARQRERNLQRRERREQRSEEFRLREQYGLSSLRTEGYSLSGEEEEEESDGGRAPPERWQPSTPSPRAAEAAEETVPGAGTGAPSARQPTKEATRVVEAPARAAETAGGAAAAALAAATTPTEPPRKRKRGFSTLR